MISGAWRAGDELLDGAQQAGEVVAYRRYQGSGLTAIWVIIGLNLLLLVATYINGSIIYLLGLQPAVFLSQPWTIVTSLFVHAGLWHLAANMLTLYFFGTYLLLLVGGNRFLIVYFGGGILGGILFLLFPGSPYSIAVGASGAIFALGGALAVLRPRLRVFVFPIPAPIPLWGAVIGGFVILWLAAGLLNIAWQAHLGGLVFGLIAGYFFRRRERRFSAPR